MPVRSMIDDSDWQFGLAGPGTKRMGIPRALAGFHGTPILTLAGRRCLSENKAVSRNFIGVYFNLAILLGLRLWTEDWLDLP